MKTFLSPLALLGLLAFLGSMEASSPKASDVPATPESASLVLGGGCFWCVEALYERLDGVIAVTSGYAGGAIPNPSYKEVCSGTTGHAEVVRIDFDPTVVSLSTLLDFFWVAHDPTTLNRQGADVGTQYRSIILYSDEAQRLAAAASMEAAQKKRDEAIVTELAPLTDFYPAEIEHQDYFRNNPNAPYCRFVIAPKVKKLES